MVSQEPKRRANSSEERNESNPDLAFPLQPSLTSKYAPLHAGYLLVSYTFQTGKTSPSQAPKTQYKPKTNNPKHDPL